MTRHLLCGAALSAVFASLALAQTSATGTGAEGAAVDASLGPDGVTPAWPVAVMTVFYADPEQTILRPADELRAQWATLSESDRDLVRRDCAAIMADASTMQGAASGGLSDSPAMAAPARATGAAGMDDDRVSSGGSDEAGSSTGTTASGHVDHASPSAAPANGSRASTPATLAHADVARICASVASL